ncbi:S-layer homology domain-containing protein [Paenibacillus sanguinis]|uniref:S-layer homology domain-containing protein n=1 Tax=Paenibacillus sanguinis TaxID=225906 RepID=UPI001969FCB0|nr:S-layer homology domain-containing protein [Paenibacillus sanguinis]
MIGIIPFQAFANSNDAMSGNGTANNPYVITTLSQLNAVRNDLNAHYKLGADIDASETANWSNGTGFLPIGNVGNGNSPFTGVFDGAGHVIRNLTIHQPKMDIVGLFGMVGSNGVIDNIALEGGLIIGNNHVGGLAGRNTGTIEHSYFTGTVRSQMGIVGGVVGYNGIHGTITSSYSTSTVAGTNYVGGLAGRNDGTVSDSYAVGTISGTSIVGGLVGDNEGGEILRSYATGAVSGSAEHVGGLVGYNISALISQSYATGAVHGGSAVGGLAGSSGHGSIIQSYATGRVNGSDHVVGGLVGSNSGTFSDSFWDADTVGLANACGYDTYGSCTASSLTTAQALTQSSYSGWDFNNDWFMVEDSTRPFLRSEWSSAIGNSHQLQLMAMDLSANYTLTQDIDFDTTFTDNSRSDMWATSAGNGFGFGFEPIGNDSTPFTGTLDGHGYDISGLYINRSSLLSVGLFGHISNGEVRDIQLKNGDVTGGLQTGMLSGRNGPSSQIMKVQVTGNVTGGDKTGGLVGNNDGMIGSSSSTATVNGMNEVGGLVGRSSIGSVTGAVYTTGSVSGISHIGGLIGLNAGQVNKAYATGQVDGQFNVGGLIGLHDMNSQVNLSFAAGNTTGMDFVGGLVGRNESGKINDSYAIGSAFGRSDVGGLVGRNIGDIRTTYAVGGVTGSSEVGGLVGREFGTVTASFYNKETTGQSDTGKGEPRVTSEMKQHALYGTEWDFNGIWGLQEGAMFPVLQGIAASLDWDVAPPTVSSAKIEREHPNNVIVTFDEEVSLIDVGGITITANGKPATIALVNGSGTHTLVFELDEAIEEDQQVFLSYDKQSGSISDHANNALLNLRDRIVDNLSRPVDHTPPSITITMTTADGMEYIDRTWSNQTVNVSAEASDESGVTSITYSLNNGLSWSPYLSDIVLREEGVHSISFKAVDTAGNESIERRTVCISTTGITLTPALVKADGSEYTSGEWTRSSVTLSVYAESGVSKIANLTYTLNGGTSQVYNNKAPIEISNEGETNIRFEASDQADNTLFLDITVRIDKTPPSITIHPNGSDMQATSATPRVTVIDSGSSIDKASLEFHWTTDSSMPATGWRPFVNEATLGKSGVDGDWYLHVRAQDQTGNAVNITSSRYRLTTQKTSETSDGSRTNGSNVYSLPSNTFFVGLEGRTIAFEGGQILIPAKALKRPFYLSINLTLPDDDEFPLSAGERLASKVVEFKRNVSGKFDQDVTISLKFDVNAIQEGSHELQLRQFNADTKEWGALDNVNIDWGEGIISGTTDHFTSFAIFARTTVPAEIGVSFTDVKGHWSQMTIENLAEKGVVNGYTDGSFRPDRTISRAEFAAILVHALGLTSKGNKDFADTTDHWARQAISTAYSYGIIQGYDSVTFGPDNFITREEMAQMVVQAFQLDQALASKTFADQDKIAAWAREAMMIAADHGIMKGYPNDMIKPKSHASRAEAITVIWRSMETKGFN